MAVVTLALSETVTEAKDSYEMQMCVPFTLRGFPDTLDQLEVNNDFACVPYWLKFPKDTISTKRVFLGEENFSAVFNQTV